MGYLKIQNWFKNKKEALYTSLLRSDFGAIGKGYLIYPPFHSTSARGIHVGEKCMIYAGGWIDAFPEYIGGRILI